MTTNRTCTPSTACTVPVLPVRITGSAQVTEEICGDQDDHRAGSV